MQLSAETINGTALVIIYRNEVVSLDATLPFTEHHARREYLNALLADIDAQVLRREFAKRRPTGVITNQGEPSWRP